MDILAINGSFAIGAFSKFKSAWNAADKSLSVWSTEKTPYPVNVTTNRGTFVEAVDKSGAVILSGGDGQWFYLPIAKEPIRLRFKTLPKLDLTKAQIEKQREVVTRYLLVDKPFNLDLPDTLPGMIQWMEGRLKMIPEASRAKAQFRFDTTTEYGETYPNIEITYLEPETDKELVTRLQVETERKRLVDDADRAKLQELQSKFAAR